MWLGIVVAVLGPLLVTPLATQHLFDQLPAVPFVLAVVVATLIGRFAAGIVATIVSVTLIDHYIIAPGRLLRPQSPEDIAAVLMFSIVALLVARFTAQLDSARAEATHERERLKLLTEAGDTLGSSLDYETTIRELGHYLVPTFADWCSVDLIDTRGVIENLVVVHRDPAKVELARDLQRRYPPDPDAATGLPHVVRTGRAELVSDLTEEMLQVGIQDPAESAAIGDLGIRSVMVVPLTANDRTFGAVTFVSAESGIRYTEGDLAFAQELAHRAALAIANARAYQAEADAKANAQEAAERNAILQGITAALGRARTRTEVAQAVLTYGLTAAGATAGVVGLLQGPDQIHIVAIAGYDPDDRAYWESFSVNDPYPLSDAIREGRAVVMHTVSERDTQYPLLAETGEREDHPLVCIPLMLGGVAIGGISASFKARSTFGEDRLAFLTAVADQAAQAIDRANAYDREQEARSQLDRLAQISQALASSLDFEATVTRVLELAAANLGREIALYLVSGRRLLPAGRAVLDEEKGVVVGALEAEWSIEGEPGEDIAKRAIAGGGADLFGEGSTAMVLPLSVAGHSSGALIVRGFYPTSSPSSEPLALPREMARRMARALENAAAYRDRDHVARTLQNSLLPPALPHVKGLDIAAIFKPALRAYEIGGDFYDVFQIPDGRWAAVIGDVCGKGIEAAALTSLARYTLRAAAGTASPSDALKALNGALIQEELDGKFCTVCLVLIDPGPAGAQLVVSSGGHPLPQLVRADGSSASVGAHGTLLGVTEDVRLVDVRARLEPGEALMLYTDGLLDRSRQHLDESEQLRPMLDPDSAPKVELKARIEAYVADLTSEQQDDDVAVLLLTAVRP